MFDIYFLLFFVCTYNFKLATSEVHNATNIFVREPDCLLFYSRNMSVKLNHTTLKFNHRPNFQIAKCENGTALLKFIFEVGSDSISQISLKMNFIHSHFGWELKNIDLSVLCNVSNQNCTSMKNIELSSSIVTAQSKNSFHCMRQHFKSLKHPSIQVDFHKFQVQPFIKNGSSFGHPNDCMGFFSESSLTILFVSFILIGILSFGLYMILNIQTFDKFDNPKGKQINIAGSE